MSLVSPNVAAAARDRRRFMALFAVAATAVVSVAVGSLAAGSPVIAVAGVAGILGVVLVAMRPDAAVLIVVALIYSNAPVVLVQFHDMPVIMAAAVPAILAAPLAYMLLVERQPIIITPAMPWIAGLLVASLLSAMLSEAPVEAASQVTSFMVEGIGLYLLMTNTIRTPEVLRAVVWVLLLVGGALGALSFLQQVTGTYGNDYFGFAQTEAAATGVTSTGLERLAGPIGEKNRYAQIMLMLVPLAILQATSERRRWLQVLALGCGALAAIATALTFSRGAAVAAGLIVLTMLALRVIKVSHIVAAIAIVAIVLFAVPSYAERVSSLADVGALLSDEPAAAGTDNSLLSRATENLAALTVWLDHPVFGVGPGQFPAYYRDYADDIGVSVRAADREAHNLYLGIAAETGILGIVAFLGAVGVTLAQLLKARSRSIARRPDLAAIASGFMLALVAYLATGMFLHLSYARYFWLMLALAGAAAVVVLRAMDEIERDEAEAAASVSGDAA